MNEQPTFKEPWMPSVGHAAMGFEDEQPTPRKRDWLMLLPFAVMPAVIHFDTPLLNWGYGLLWALWLGYSVRALWLWQRRADRSFQNAKPEIKLRLRLATITLVWSSALLVATLLGGNWQWTSLQVNTLIYPLLALVWLAYSLRQRPQGP